MTTVSGIVRDTQGNALPGLSVSVRYLRPLVGSSGGAAVQNARVFTTDGSGEVVMEDLLSGRYDIAVMVPPSSEVSEPQVVVKGTMTVLDEATQTLEEALDSNVGAITPSLVQQAIQAAQDAQDAAAQAQAISGLEGGVTTSPMDPTPGRVTQAGDYGWGLGAGQNAVILDDIDSLDFVSGLHRIAGATSGDLPSQVTNVNCTMLALRGQFDQNLREILFPAFGANTSIFHRRAIGGPATEWGDWRMVYDTQNVVGDMADDAVIQRGSGPNGEFVRFADGTQMCWRTQTTDDTDTTTWVFPASFVDGNTSASVITRGLGLSRRYVRIVSITAGGGEMTYNIFNSTNDRVQEEVRLMAIGRYK